MATGNSLAGFLGFHLVGGGKALEFDELAREGVVDGVEPRAELKAVGWTVEYGLHLALISSLV